MRKQDASKSMLTMAASLLLKECQLNLEEINLLSKEYTGQVTWPTLLCMVAQTQYRREPRASRQQRRKQHGQHGLLSTLSPGQNPSVLTCLGGIDLVELEISIWGICGPWEYESGQSL
jgi:hypothetical protein